MIVRRVLPLVAIVHFSSACDGLGCDRVAQPNTNTEAQLLAGFAESIGDDYARWAALRYEPTIVVRRHGSGVCVVSVGEDGREGTADDVGPWPHEWSVIMISDEIGMLSLIQMGRSGELQFERCALDDECEVVSLVWRHEPCRCGRCSIGLLESRVARGSSESLEVSVCMPGNRVQAQRACRGDLCLERALSNGVACPTGTVITETTTHPY